MNISNVFQFIIGFVLGVIFFSVGIAGGAYFFLTRLSANPSKPVFSEENQEQVAENPVSELQSDQDKDDSEIPENQVETKIEPEVENKEAENKDNDLPPGAYRATVTWSTGLSLRAEPSINAARIGGVGYNWELIVLEYSNDRDWQKVRIPSSGEEGWVKAGNVAKID
jgi:hypothetical protein